MKTAARATPKKVREMNSISISAYKGVEKMIPPETLLRLRKVAASTGRGLEETVVAILKKTKCAGNLLFLPLGAST